MRERVERNIQKQLTPTSSSSSSSWSWSSSTSTSSVLSSLVVWSCVGQSRDSRSSQRRGLSTEQRTRNRERETHTQTEKQSERERKRKREEEKPVPSFALVSQQARAQQLRASSRVLALLLALAITHHENTAQTLHTQFSTQSLEILGQRYHKAIESGSLTPLYHKTIY